MFSRHSVLVFLGAMFIVTDAQAFYTEPTRRTVLNEVVEASKSEPQEYPLYLSDAGRYYTEIYLEPREQTNHHAKPVKFRLKLEVIRKDRVLKSEIADLSLRPGEIHKTLFWTKTPWDLPQRKAMTVRVSVVEANDEFRAHYDNVRLQMTRKFEFAPILR